MANIGAGPWLNVREEDWYKSQKYNYTLGGKDVPTPGPLTPAPTAYKYNYQINKLTTKCDNSSNNSNRVVKINTSSTDITINFPELESHQTDCCIKEVTDLKDSSKYIIGRQLNNTMCSNKVCNTNFILTNNGDPNKGDDIAGYSKDKQSNYMFYNNASSVKRSDILLTKDPDTCCKNFSLYKIANNDNQTNKFKNNINNKSAGDVQKFLKDTVYNNLSKWFEADAQTNYIQDSGRYGVCLYTDGQEKPKLDTLTNIDQSTWSSSSDPKPPAETCSDKPCVINLVQQLGGRWYTDTKHKIIGTKFNDIKNDAIKNNIINVYLSNLINNLLRPIDDLVKENISDKGYICETSTCYCKLNDVSKLGKILTPMPPKNIKKHNIFTMHKNISSVKELEATQSGLGRGMPIDMNRYIFFVDRGGGMGDSDYSSEDYYRIQINKDDNNKLASIQNILQTYFLTPAPTPSPYIGNAYDIYYGHPLPANFSTSNIDLLIYGVPDKNKCTNSNQSDSDAKINACEKGNYFNIDDNKCEDLNTSKTISDMCNPLLKPGPEKQIAHSLADDSNKITRVLSTLCPGFPTPSPAPGPCPAGAQCIKVNQECTMSPSCSTGGCCPGFKCKNKGGGGEMAQTVCVKNP